MKKSKQIRAFISIVLVAMMILSGSVIGLVGVASAETLSLDYKYLYDNPGYAQGRVVLSGAQSDYGMYYLYWADDTKALEGYSYITKLNLDKESRSFNFDEFTAIPAGATKIIALRSDTEPTVKTVAASAAVYDIPVSKQFKYEDADKAYNFQALSDVHIHKQDPPYYTYSELHFGQALEAAAQRDADFVTICGDMINGYDNLYATEWDAYQKVIANSSFCNPIYETNGNHETKSDGDKAADVPYTRGIETYKTATGLNVKTEAMQDESYYEITAPNGDHFIFMVLELDSSPNESNEFTQAQMTWLKGLLSKYYGDGHKIFINEHALFSKYGAGDDKELPLYGGALQDTYPVVKELKALLEQYPDVIFMSGHSHIDFKYGYNIDNENGTTAYTIHIPATTSTTLISGGSLEYAMREDSSQGYFVDVYDDCVIFNGTDLVKNLIYPAYTYLIDYSGQELVKNNIGDDNASEDTVTVTVDISNLSKNTEYVYCYAYADDIEQINYPGTKMTRNDDGTYTAKISSSYTKMSFLFNDSVLGKMGTDTYEVNNCKVVIGSEKVTYSAPSSWGNNVNLYVFSSETNSSTFTWPGIPMTKDTATGQFYAYIPADSFDMVVFNNDPGSLKTNDLQLAPYVTEGIKGSYTIVEPEVTEPEPTTTEKVTDPEPTTTEKVTDPEPTTTEKVTETDTQPITTAPKVTDPEPTNPVEPEPFYGDATCDGRVNVKDATAIQKHVALLDSLTEQGEINADVTGDTKVNIVDATTIQKKVAQMIDVFPVEKKELAPTGATASSLTTLISSVKTTLADEYYYASYDAYMALKKAYYAYKNVTISSLSADEVNTAYNSINTALTDYNTMKKNNPVGAAAGGEITVYFTNNYNWSSVKAYAWGSGGTMKTWPGADMTYAKTNSQSQKIYSITFDYSSYQNIIFSNGSGSQTVDITLTGETGIGYYISGTSGGKYTCSTYTYM